ncbi:MAG: C-terminal target protein [Bacteroidota bacterium]|jgi:Leucine-rich repeat (LRR) protein|nr:C-terminal target protein [Bacteroidota bacterium]
MKNLFTLLALLICLTNNIQSQNTVTIQDTSFLSWLQVNVPAAMTGNQMDTTHSDVTSRRQVIIQNRHILNLNGIQYFDSLKTLDCSLNIYDTLFIRIKTIPALPALLDTLICNGNAIDSLPQLPNGLLLLQCSQNLLDSLPALPNTIKLLECWGNQLTDLPALPDSLQHLNCCNNQLQGIPALPDSLTFLKCDFNQLQSLPVLPDSLNTLLCTHNNLTALPALPNSIGSMDCSYNQITALPALPIFLPALFCNNNQLTTLPSLPNSITFIDCSFNQINILPALPTSLIKLNCSYNTLPSLPTLPNTLEILYCGNNQLPVLPALPASLIDLDCSTNLLPVLPSLPLSLTTLICRSNHLPALPLLPPSLNTLDCSANQITNLPALPNSLISLICSSNQLNNLPALPGSLGGLNCNSNSIAALPSLPGSLIMLECISNQLSALPALPQNLMRLDCQSNNIHCFDPFGNISNYLNISHNPFTCLPNYIPVMDSVTLLYPLCAAGNPFNCPSAFGIVGFTYTDENGSCLKDSGDVGLRNIPLKIYDNASDLIGTTYTASNGVYQFLNSANTFTVKIDTVGKPFAAGCSFPGIDSTVTVAVLDTNINFALKCGQGFDIGIQSISTCGIIFPGQTHNLRLNVGDMSHWYNLNCASGLSGTISFLVTGPVTYMGPVAGALIPNVSGNLFTYNIVDFGTVNNIKDFQIQLQPFPTAQAGDVICIQAKVTPTGGDNYPANNTYTTCYTVVNSHDPNIKEVYPVDVPFDFNDWLTYTIHFQNTGNAPAFNIKIDDELDTLLDVSTFEVIDYSHPNSTSLIGRNLSVYFANIQLPDSSSDKEGSIGFVQYRIKPKASWVIPLQIKNTAYIYFDFNPPIVTNTTINSLLDFSTGITKQKENNMAIYPNPNNGLFTIHMDSKENLSVRLYDIAGNIILVQTLENGNGAIDASHLAAGIYNIQIKGEATVTNKKLVIVK